MKFRMTVSDTSWIDFQTFYMVILAEHVFEDDIQYNKAKCNNVGILW